MEIWRTSKLLQGQLQHFKQRWREKTPHACIVEFKRWWVKVLASIEFTFRRKHFFSSCPPHVLYLRHCGTLFKLREELRQTLVVPCCYIRREVLGTESAELWWSVKRLTTRKTRETIGHTVPGTPTALLLLLREPRDGTLVLYVIMKYKNTTTKERSKGLRGNIVNVQKKRWRSEERKRKRRNKPKQQQRINKKGTGQPQQFSDSEIKICMFAVVSSMNVGQTHTIDDRRTTMLGQLVLVVVLVVGA